MCVNRLFHWKVVSVRIETCTALGEGAGGTFLAQKEEEAFLEMTPELKLKD